MKLAGTEAEALAQSHGTPYYLYDIDAALAHLAVLRAHLPPSVDVFYCLKANGNRKILDAFRPHVAGLDLSSAGELDMAVAAGYDPKRASIAGPGKTLEDLERCVDGGVGIVSLESVAELGRLGKVAQARGKKQDVTLRINPVQTPKEFAMRMGGGASQFGVPEEEAEAALDAVQAEPGVRLVGLHIYAGTQCLEESALVENMMGSLGIVARLANEKDLSADQLRVVNLGGGFGIPYFAGQTAVDPAPLGRAISAKLEEWRAANPRFAKTRFIFELGRYLIGLYGVYVSRVTEIKETRGKRFVILDGGMHHCFPATGNFGQMVKKNYPVKNLTRSADDAEEHAPQEICGPLCTPMDSMARAVRIPRAEPGDLIGFFASGAYSFAASPLLFLSHDTPLELVKQGEVTVARGRMPATRFW